MRDTERLKLTFEHQFESNLGDDSTASLRYSEVRKECRRFKSELAAISHLVRPLRFRTGKPRKTRNVDQGASSSETESSSLAHC